MNVERYVTDVAVQAAYSYDSADVRDILAATLPHILADIEAASTGVWLAWDYGYGESVVPFATEVEARRYAMSAHMSKATFVPYGTRLGEAEE